MVQNNGLPPCTGTERFLDYDDTLNPGASTEFATAAFRFGHSQIPVSKPIIGFGHRQFSLYADTDEGLAVSLRINLMSIGSWKRQKEHYF